MHARRRRSFAIRVESFEKTVRRIEETAGAGDRREPHDALDTEHVSVGVHRLGQTVREEDQAVARTDIHLLGRTFGQAFFLSAYWRVLAVQDVDLPGATSDQERPRMSRATVRQRLVGKLELSNQERDEQFRAAKVTNQELVELFHEVSRRKLV